MYKKEDFKQDILYLAGNQDKVNYLNNKVSERMLFCNIAYMKNYSGTIEDDKPYNGGKYVLETGDCLEKYNFMKCSDGKVRGFVETKYRDGYQNMKEPQMLHIENIDSRFKDKEEIDNVNVIFCASKERNLTVIVGFYNKATVYRNRRVYEGREYNIECDFEDTLLIPIDERTMKVPRAKNEDFGFGQANLWYANEENSKQFKNKILKYIKSAKILKELEEANKDRITSVDKWKKILLDLKEDTGGRKSNETMLKVFNELYHCKDYSLSSKKLNEKLGFKVNGLNSTFAHFGKYVIDKFGIEEQYREDNSLRYWNLALKIVGIENDSIVFKLRSSFVKALEEVFELEEKTIELEESEDIKDKKLELKNVNIIGNHKMNYTNKDIIRPRNDDIMREINNNKKIVGNTGEELVVYYEKENLELNGKQELADKVTIEQNEAAGYDVISYDLSGNPKYIEVKTKTGNLNYMDFFITENELNKMKEVDNYYIYYVSNLKSNKPTVSPLNKEDILKREKEILKPVVYRVRVDIEE